MLLALLVSLGITMDIGATLTTTDAAHAEMAMAGAISAKHTGHGTL